MSILLKNSVPRYNVKIRHENLEKDILKLLEDIRTSWSEKDVKIVTLENGFVNAVVKCSLGNSSKDAIVIKVDSETMDIVPERSKREISELVLNELGLSPPLVCQFENGAAHEFLEGRSFTWDDHREFVTNENLTRAVLKEMAKYHVKKNIKLAEALGHKFTSSFRFDVAKRMIENFPDKMDDERFKQIFPKEKIKEEMKKIDDMIEESNLQFVFAHGDINPSNIFQTKDGIIFIDYDTAMPDYAEYDLAWFIVSAYAGFGNERPDKTWKKKMIKIYLEYLNQMEGIEKAVEDTEVERYFVNCEKMELFMNFTGILYMIEFANTPPEIPSPIKIDLLAVAITKQELYIRMRDEIFSLPCVK